MKNSRIRLILLLVGLCIYMPSKAQLNIGGQPYSFKQLAASRHYIPTQTMHELNMAQIEREDLRDDAQGLPPRFGFPFDVHFDLNNSGHWETLDNGDRIWRLNISSPGAKSINLLYDAFWLPEGANLYIYNESRSHLIGGLTARNNNSMRGESKGFATGLVYGDKITLEYYEPEVVAGQGELSISKVVHGYRYIQLSGINESRSLGSSGDCQVNINCAEGVDWQIEKNGVAMILVDGFRICTGSLVVTTTGELSPYFLTADHCLGNLDAINEPNASTWSFLWNYESPNCDDPDSEEEIDFFSTSGATVVANNSNSDFALLRLMEDPIELSIPLSYLGWDATGNSGTGGSGIHHPSGDVKKIATHSMVPLSDDNDGFNEPDTHWKVFWDNTSNGHSVTEGGSSGSPLFDNNRRIIGQLHGGGIGNPNCSDPERDDGIYGKFSVSWTGNGSNNRSRRLYDWLAPACQEILNITQNINAEHPIYQANNSIIASNNIYDNAYAMYLGGNSVVLQPGFNAFKGSQFVAKIGGCGASRIESRSNIFQLGSYALPDQIYKTSDNYSQGSNMGKNRENNMEIALFSVYPNPFTSTTTLAFNLSKAIEVSISIRNSLGQIVAQPVYKEQKYAGVHTLEFNRGHLPSGVYYCILETNGRQFVQKLVISR